jgi:membrane protease subunit (stomatin/prohibitin family)
MMNQKEIENTGMECSAILYIQKHGEEGWAYAFANFCDNCGCINTCNIVNGKVKITPKGIKMDGEKKEVS